MPILLQTPPPLLPMMDKSIPLSTDNVHSTWSEFTKFKNTKAELSRLENISWRIWHALRIASQQGISPPKFTVLLDAATSCMIDDSYCPPISDFFMHSDLPYVNPHSSQARKSPMDLHDSKNNSPYRHQQAIPSRSPSLRNKKENDSVADHRQNGPPDMPPFVAKGTFSQHPLINAKVNSTNSIRSRRLVTTNPSNHLSPLVSPSLSQSTSKEDFNVFPMASTPTKSRRPYIIISLPSVLLVPPPVPQRTFSGSGPSSYNSQAGVLIKRTPRQLDLSNYFSGGKVAAQASAAAQAAARMLTYPNKKPVVFLIGNDESNDL